MLLAGMCARRRTYLSLLRQRKVGQRKTTLLSVSPSLRYGATCGARSRGVPQNSLRAARSVQTTAANQFTMHARFDAHAHPASAPPQAQPQGVNSLTRAIAARGLVGRAVPDRAERSDGVIGVGFQLNPIDTCAAPSRSGRHAAAPAPQKLRRLPDHQPCRGKVLHVARDDAVQARVPGGFVQHGVFVVGKAGVQRVGQR